MSGWPVVVHEAMTIFWDVVHPVWGEGAVDHTVPIGLFVSVGHYPALGIAISAIQNVPIWRKSQRKITAMSSHQILYSPKLDCITMLGKCNAFDVVGLIMDDHCFKKSITSSKTSNNNAFWKCNSLFCIPPYLQFAVLFEGCIPATKAVLARHLGNNTQDWYAGKHFPKKLTKFGSLILVDAFCILWGKPFVMWIDAEK